jgi:gliding motility-associated-like protein
MCSDSAAETINLYAPLQVTTSPDSICAGRNTTVNVNVTGGKPGYIYNWSDSLGNGPGPYTVSPASSISYTCFVTDGCGNKDSVSTPVFVLPSPKAIFSPTPDSIMGGQYVSFVDSSTNANSWYWTFGDGNSSFNPFPYYQYVNRGNYVVTLIVQDQFGCTDTVRHTVYVAGHTIYVPNVFTPNGDGQNDVFHVTVSGIQTYSIEIYNQWGQEIFVANSPYIDWDGRSSSGVEEPDGTYYYLIKATDYDNRAYHLEGFTQIIRNGN